MANSVNDELTRELRAKGYRLTPQRQLVLEAVATLDHATPDEICEQVRRTARGINLSTVYRTLELLEQLHLITHTHLGHGAPVYHTREQAPHLHLVCRDCENIIEADIGVAEGLIARLAEEHGFETDVSHFAIFGRCRDCVAKHGTTH